MPEFAEVVLPSGEHVWVRAEQPDGDRSPSGPSDVNLTHGVVTALQVPGFAEAVSGVVSSVRMAVDKHLPSEMTVEFGIEINAKTGKVFSVLAEAGGKAHVKVTAKWERSAATTQPVAAGLANRVTAGQ